ncbi:hypothetical protein LCGC14_2684880, partial [marine sediment metagenome]
IVYKKDKKVARFADDLRNFRITESDKKTFSNYMIHRE